MIAPDIRPSWVAFSAIVLAVFILAVGYQCSRPVVETVVVQETPTRLPVTVLPTNPPPTPTVLPDIFSVPTATLEDDLSQRTPLPTATATPQPTATMTPEPTPTRVPQTPIQKG